MLNEGTFPPLGTSRPAAPDERPIILLIEDSIQEAMLIRFALEKSHARLRLEHVIDGRVAVDYFKGAGRYADRKVHPIPQLVILDLHLPGLHGMEVLRFIREQTEYFSLPVFIFTDSLNPNDRARAKSIGATGYLEKPSGIEALVEMVNNIQRYLVRKAAQER